MTRTLELLDRLVAFPTVSHASNLDLIDWAEALLKTAGFATTRIPSPNRDKAGLHARIGPDLPGGFCLSGHTDVVPVEGQVWTRDPFTLTRDGTRVFGRGATDMKGFVASALAAAERAGTMRLNAPLSLVLSYDEEVGCVGIRDMLPALEPLLHQPRLVIVGEPTGMKVGIGHKGKTALRVMCKGEAGHSALAPKFINAIHVASRFVAEMQSLQTELACSLQEPGYEIPYSTIHIGKIIGGSALNIVPDSVVLDMELRCLAQTSVSELLDKIDKAATRVESAFHRKGIVDVEIVNAYPGLQADPAIAETEPLCQLTGNAKAAHLDFGTEAGFFAGLGLNSIVIGPGDMSSDGHKPDESLSLEQLDACDALMNRVLAQLSE